MSSFLPSIGTLPILDFAIQKGRGAAAAVIGQTYDVRRLTNTTNVAVSSNTPIYRNFPVRLERTTSKHVIENTLFELLAFKGTCDNLALELMDQLTETGYEDMPQGTYIFAQARPTRESIFMRAELNCTLSAIAPTAGAASQQPESGNVAITSDQGWSGVWKESEEVLVLQNGLYSFKGPDDPYWQTQGAAQAQIQVGIQPNGRARDGTSLDVPTEQYRGDFIAYLPVLPGVFLEEVKIRINVGNATADRYEFKKYYTSDETGIAGNIALCEKLPF